MKRILPIIFSVIAFGLTAQNLYFPPVPPTSTAWTEVDINSLGWCTDNLADFDTYLVNSGTYGLIILKDGKIAYETYPNGQAQLSTPWQGASFALGTVLAKILDDDGFINITDKASSVLGTGWSSAPSAKEDLITIENILNFTTGLSDTDPDCVTPACLSYEADAGTQWGYHKGTFKLLLDIIKNHPEFGNDLNFAFLRSGLFQNDGPGLVGSFTPGALNANTAYTGTTRDAARFGLMMLARGRFGNSTIINDDAFFDKIFSAGANPNKSYGSHFWLNGQSSYMEPGSNTPTNGRLNPNAPSDMVSAIGKGGQFIDIIPSQNIVVIRQGLAFFDQAEVPLTLHREFWGELSKVACNIVGVEETPIVDESIAFPNPFNDFITVYGKSEVKSVRIFDAFGKKVFEVEGQKDILVSDLPKGMYFFEVTDGDDVRSIKKMIKE